MIIFFLKGVLRDRSRSLFPILTVFAGVFLSVLLYSYMNGVIAEMLRSTAHFQTGHLRVMTRAYSQEVDQSPNDLALIGVEQMTGTLGTEAPDLIWLPRIKFGGILDIPDENGETMTQGPVSGMAIDLFSKEGFEAGFLNIEKAIVRGRIPNQKGEILISDQFASQLKVAPGDTATLISSTMSGSMATANFNIVGTVRFGISAMDRGTIITDISDMQFALDMADAAGEILGFFRNDIYKDEQAQSIAAAFNDKYSSSNDPYAPRMGALPQESGLADYLEIMDSAALIIVAVFILAMSIVLWNAGLMGSLRRYGEIGVRLAIGEDKGHVYRSLVAESMIIGIFGSILGTLAGAAAAYWMQVYGIDIGFMLKNASLMMSDVLRAQVTMGSFLIGFIPGIGATVLGAAIAGIGIFKRETSQLFKELEV